jgi:ribosomal protein L4
MSNMNLVDVKTLVATDILSHNTKLASRNIPYVTLKRVNDINCLDVLSAECLLITKKGLKQLEQRCATKK